MENTKLFVSVDMEGVACVTHSNHVKSEGPEYEMARKWMTAEVNAAVQGAMAAGATEVIVADAHGSMYNLIPDELPEDVLLVRGTPRPLLQMEGLDETFGAAFFVGYHSMAGTGTGVLSHTHIGNSVYAVRLNGTAMGESGFNAAVAGHLGVPVALVCGDDTVDAEVRELLPWAERVITKWALSPNAARNLTPKAAQRRIREGAKHALKRLSESKPLVVETPVRLEAEFQQPRFAYLAGDIPGVERVDGRTLAYTGADMLEVNRVWRLMINASLGEYSV